jgi:NTE family protein
LLNEPDTLLLAEEADEHVFNIVQMIYRAKTYEGSSKDYEFSRRTMMEHWQAGHSDGVRTLKHEEVLERPDNPAGIRTFDLARDGRH